VCVHILLFIPKTTNILGDYQISSLLIKIKFLDNQRFTDMFFRNMRNPLIVNHLRQPLTRADLT
jgi:hypothetical protein